MRRLSVVFQHGRLGVLGPIKLFAIFKGRGIKGEGSVKDLLVALGFHHILQKLFGQFLLFGKFPHTIVERNGGTMLACRPLGSQGVVGDLEDIGHFLLGHKVDADGVVHPGIVATEEGLIITGIVP